ncbi:hypothetical protein [Mucilaginibacter paludis]|uniref:Transcription activator effector binding n=1 Tax=Mucilaginibacter paludis DSM 18603 TaxID=714943 RepID=H1Y0C6_9SPHI|nr:hypothetical protein [Mucilaginibacter paludis]EHQ28175.1 hypothetical protein Mucpa_4084 [Mucilaginibacter paludis DSM 18603]
MEIHQQTETVNIFYVQAESFPEGIMKAFDQLYALMEDKEQHTLFGISKPDKNTIAYKAGALEKYPNEGKRYGCYTFVLEKGDYLSETITNWQAQVEKIGFTFSKILTDQRIDPAAYCIEWYRDNDVTCMVKIIAE